MHMRSFTAIAIVVAIGLVWSVAAMIQLVPVVSGELLRTPITVGQSKSVSVY
jgi:hypothetical protein